MLSRFCLVHQQCVGGEWPFDLIETSRRIEAFSSAFILAVLQWYRSRLLYAFPLVTYPL